MADVSDYKKTDILNPSPSNRGWYWPLVVYIILALIILIAVFSSGKNAIILLIVAVIFGVLVWWLSKRGYTGWAWTIVLLPYVIIGILASVIIINLDDGVGL